MSSGTFLQPVMAVLGAALIVLGFSELVFFNEEPARAAAGIGSAAGALDVIAVLVAFYLLPGALLVACHPMLTTWPRALFVGALVGWVIEASVVSVVYEGIPVSFVWPSVSWHAFVDVGFGYVLLRLMLRRTLRAAVVTTVLFGLGWGLWSSWPWPDARLTAGEFARLALVTAALLSVGIALVDRVPPETGLPRWAAWTVVLVCLALGGLQMVPFVPLGLGLVPLVALTVWALWRSPPGPAPLVAGAPPPVWRCLLPFGAGGIAWGVYGMQLQAGRGIPADTVIPLMLVVTTAVFLALLGWALLRRRPVR